MLAVLTTLARDFGYRHPEGIRIELRLTHRDLVGAAVGSRANVTRALDDLRTAGLVLVEQHRLGVTQRGLGYFEHGGRNPWGGWPTTNTVSCTTQ